MHDRLGLRLRMSTLDIWNLAVRHQDRAHPDASGAEDVVERTVADEDAVAGVADVDGGHRGLERRRMWLGPRDFAGVYSAVDEMVDTVASEYLFMAGSRPRRIRQHSDAQAAIAQGDEHRRRLWIDECRRLPFRVVCGVGDVVRGYSRRREHLRESSAQMLNPGPPPQLFLGGGERRTDALYVRGGNELCGDAPPAAAIARDPWRKGAAPIEDDRLDRHIHTLATRGARGMTRGGDNVGVPSAAAGSTTGPTPSRHNPRWAVAERVSEALRERWHTDLQAIGVHGALAHGDDTDVSDVAMVAVTRRSNTGPAPGTRRIDGVIVDLGVVSADEYLRHARTLTTSWPLVADQYLTTKALHDPDHWLPRLRDTHLTRLAQAEGQVFAALAREAWCRASIAHGRARRMIEWYETESAMVVLGEARLAVAVVEGLLTRTYFRNSADAVRRMGVASSHIYDLAERLAAQAQDLARRGRPVDGEVADLLGR